MVATRSIHGGALGSLGEKQDEGGGQRELQQRREKQGSRGGEDGLLMAPGLGSPAAAGPTRRTGGDAGEKEQGSATAVGSGLPCSSSSGACSRTRARGGWASGTEEVAAGGSGSRWGLAGYGKRGRREAQVDGWIFGSGRIPRRKGQEEWRRSGEGGWDKIPKI